MNYGIHNAAEASYALAHFPDEIDGIEVKKRTDFGLPLADFHKESYKTTNSLYHAERMASNLGVSGITQQLGKDTMKQLPVPGVAPIYVFKQPMMGYEVNGTPLELVTRGSFVVLPGLEDSHKIISLQQYVRRAKGKKIVR